MAVNAKSDLSVFPPVIHGHEAIEAQLAEAILSRRLPSAYLFTGIQGIGKASMAFRLAVSLLAPPQHDDDREVDLFAGTQVSPPSTATLKYQKDSSTLGRISQGSHPDFMRVHPEYDQKKQVFKREILIGQVRAIGTFLSRTAGEGGWKIVLIDSVDALGIHASNALLKWLEEPPPQSLFILISHKPDALLPTIPSRCREHSFAVPAFSIFERIVGESEMQPEQLRFLNRVTGGSPGLAHEWMRTGWLHHVRYLTEFLGAKPEAQPYLLAELGEAAMKDAAFTLSHWQALLDMFLLAVVQCHQGTENSILIPEVKQAAEYLSRRFSLSHCLSVWDRQRAVYRDSETLYLDKRYTLMQLLGQMVATA